MKKLINVSSPPPPLFPHSTKLASEINLFELFVFFFNSRIILLDPM